MVKKMVKNGKIARRQLQAVGSYRKMLTLGRLLRVTSKMKKGKKCENRKRRIILYMEYQEALREGKGSERRYWEKYQYLRARRSSAGHVGYNYAFRVKNWKQLDRILIFVGDDSRIRVLITTPCELSQEERTKIRIASMSRGFDFKPSIIDENRKRRLSFYRDYQEAVRGGWEKRFLELRTRSRSMVDDYDRYYGVKHWKDVDFVLEEWPARILIRPSQRLREKNIFKIRLACHARSFDFDFTDKDVVLEGLGSVDVYDQWVAPPIFGQLPRARNKHGAAVINDKMYVFCGNCKKGRYLKDLQVLDVSSLTWSKVEVKAEENSLESSSPVPIPPHAGHYVIAWGGNKLLSVARHTDDPFETMLVKVFDLQTCTWSTLKTYGKPPVSREGQSVTLVETSLVIFGGQDAKRSLLNDLHILDLKSMTWDEMNASGEAPSPRSDHAATGHAGHYLLIFGGASTTTCFNDLHVLDLQAMEWSRPTQQGEIPTPRAGHAGVTVGENWFIVGGVYNKSGVSETVVLNMSTMVWSVVTTAQGHVPLASEGLSLVRSSYGGEDILISFGGYNGRYNNEVNVLKPKMMGTPVLDIVSAVHNATNATKDFDSEFETGEEGKARETVMDNVDLEPTGNQNGKLQSLDSLQLKEELSEAETRKGEL